jgi:hypothetical protein
MTNFEAPTVYSVNIKNFDVRIQTWNPQSEETQIVETTLPPHPQEIEIKKDGLTLLRDYISLLFRRPFLSLSTIGFTLLPRPLPRILADTFVANSVHLEAGANLFAFKYSETGLNKTCMRELLSFADGFLLSQFRHPAESMHP